jgi:hypothetical protein
LIAINVCDDLPVRRESPSSPFVTARYPNAARSLVDLADSESKAGLQRPDG